MANQKVSVIIAAGGTSTRFNSGSKKQFTELADIPILAHCLITFDSCPDIYEIVVVTPEDELRKTASIIKDIGLKKIISSAAGGKERKLSVYNGFLKLAPDTDVVIIHDAARPFLTKELVQTVVGECVKHGACIAAIPVTDTIKAATEDNTVDKTVPRNNLWRAQTPQAFRYGILKDIYSRSDLENTTATDESQLAEQAGITVKITRGMESNIKITTPEDLGYARFLINEGLV